MANKSKTTVVVLRAPQQPLACLRVCDLPIPLEIGQVFDFDGILYQQTHKPVVCVARNSKGNVANANTLLRGLLLRLYGEEETMHTIARGSINYSAVSCTNEKTVAGGIRIGVDKLLADDCEDLVFVTCRIVDAQYLRDSLNTVTKPFQLPQTFSLHVPDAPPVPAKKTVRRAKASKT